MSKTIKYQHTQIGYLMIFVSIAVAIFYEAILAEVDFNSIIFAVMGLTLFILLSFASLKVTIDESYLRIKFGYGIFQKQFLLSEIVSAKLVKNPWYYGWGIRWWPSMWIYNVSGFDAVEITMRGGTIYRIGTDEPQELESAIKREIKS